MKQCRAHGKCDVNHPWQHLEESFQKLLPILFGERPPICKEENDALVEIHMALVMAAGRVFRSPGFKGVDCDTGEAAQAWFIRVRAAKHKYDPARPFHKYAYTILGRLCRDLGRRARLRNGRRLSPAFAAAIRTAPEVALWREERRRVRQALRELKRNGSMSREQRNAIACRYYRGWPSRKAGERYNVSAATIDMWAHQARKILGNHLRKSA